MEESMREILENGCDLEERGEFAQAVRNYRRAARGGIVEAQINLGNLLDEGRGCRRNAAEAVYWYKRAYKRGNAEAAFNLAVHYKSRGMTRWQRFWLDRAAALGDQMLSRVSASEPRS